MPTTFHLESADSIDSSILKAIKSAFKSKAITITVEEDLVLTDEMKNVLEERLVEDDSAYLTSSESIAKLNKKFGV